MKAKMAPVQLDVRADRIGDELIENFNYANNNTRRKMEIGEGSVLEAQPPIKTIFSGAGDLLCGAGICRPTGLARISI